MFMRLSEGFFAFGGPWRAGHLELEKKRAVLKRRKANSRHSFFFFFYYFLVLQSQVPEIQRLVMSANLWQVPMETCRFFSEKLFWEKAAGCAT